MKAVILAAGYATRLYPLTLNKAKPLLEVAGKPIIQHIAEKLLSAGVAEKDILVVSNSKFYNDFRKWNSKITVLDDGSTSEENKLGAIGDIAFALKNVEDDVLILAGDNFFTFDLNQFLKFSKGKNFAIVGRELETLEDAKKHGNIEIDSNNRITNFIEKPLNPKTKLSAICVYYISKKYLTLFSRYLEEKTNKDAPGYFMEWLAKNNEVYAWIDSSAYFDIGDKEKLELARRYADEHFN